MPAMNASTQALICPKCGSDMRSYERNGITIDQCTGCRGVFLDRGELERLVDAEGSFYERESSSEQRPEKRRDEEQRDDRRRDEKPRKSKKKSFLENILEMGGE